VPELPDVVAYLAALEPRVIGEKLEAVRLGSPFLLRSVAPPLSEAEGRTVLGLRRLGKRLVFELEDELFLVLHLMIAGRLHWRPRGARVAGRASLAAFDFPDGALLLTEASTKKRASLHLIRGEAALAELDRGGLEPLEADLSAFRRALLRENHTVKRALTDPRLFSGIGNAYSDEILHRARLSPAKWTSRLSDQEIERLYRATRETLGEWTERFVAEARRAFPEKVRAFREGMAVHGRYGKPCPRCGSPVQRIVYAENESNYCAACQTGGRLLADRALSQLLRGDWPKTLEELEERKETRRRGIGLGILLFTGLGLVSGPGSAGAADRAKWFLSGGGGPFVHLGPMHSEAALALLAPQRSWPLGGRFEYVVEGHFSRAFGPDGYVAGILPVGGRFFPRRRGQGFYFGIAAGLGWTDLTELPEIDRRFNYFLQGGPGLRWGQRERFLEMRLFHLSNRNTKGRNLGANSVLLVSGWRVR
jgi:formamidopyrimidine-DNA glycosylase